MSIKVIKIVKPGLKGSNQQLYPQLTYSGVVIKVTLNIQEMWFNYYRKFLLINSAKKQLDFMICINFTPCSLKSKQQE